MDVQSGTHLLDLETRLCHSQGRGSRECSINSKMTHEELTIAGEGPMYQVSYYADPDGRKQLSPEEAVEQITDRGIDHRWSMGQAIG